MSQQTADMQDRQEILSLKAGILNQSSRQIPRITDANTDLGFNLMLDDDPS